MKLLLTSAGIKDDSIKAALVNLLGKPIHESSALCIPTAMYGHPWVGPGTKVWDFISGNEPRTPMAELGWKSVGVLELTALPSLTNGFVDAKGPRGRCAIGRGRGCRLLGPLDARIGDDGFASGAAGHDLGGPKCGEYGDGTAYWR